MVKPNLAVYKSAHGHFISMCGGNAVSFMPCRKEEDRVEDVGEEPHRELEKIVENKKLMEKVMSDLGRVKVSSAVKRRKPISIS